MNAVDWEPSEVNSGAHRGATAGFSKRVAAAWIDCFVVYAIASFLITLGSTTRASIALEPLFLLVGAVYGAALVGRGGQTVGKMLVGIAVTVNVGQTLRLRHVLIREVLGKWVIGIAVPVALGKALAGQGSVATVYDAMIRLPGLGDSPGIVLLPMIYEALILLAAVLLQLVHYLVEKRTWYDQLAGTAVVRTVGTPRCARFAFAALMGAAVLALGSKGTEFALRGRVPCRLAPFQSMRSTAPYEAFLRRGHATPVDYIIGLFDRHDVVVICERLHPEGSQWDFIYEVVSDPRFVERVGHVFTEYGQVEMQPYLDRFMATDGLAESEVHQRAVHIMRHWPVWPVWNNTNFFTYLTRLYALNQSLPATMRIHHHFTDVSVKWAGLTRKAYWAYRRSLGNRDEQLARRVITEMGHLAEAAATTPKCLVVMNFRHAFDLTGRRPAAQRFNTFEYLKDAFGERAVNVLLNTRILLTAPIAGGVWDAAFEKTGNRPAGFDLEDSPFGQDAFDLFPFLPDVKRRLKYRGVFTGLLFTHPLEKQYMQHGIPGYFEGFEEEALRRAMLIGEGYRRRIETLIDREKRRDVAVKKPLPDRESQIELSLLGFMSVGLLIGVGLFAASWRAQGRQRGVEVKTGS